MATAGIHSIFDASCSVTLKAQTLDSLSRRWQTFNELTNPKAVVGCLGPNVFDPGVVLQR